MGSGSAVSVFLREREIRDQAVSILWERAGIKICHAFGIKD